MTYELLFPKEGTATAGTVVVVHGLNISPQAMRTLAQEFVEHRGQHVVLTTLRGHGVNDSGREQASAQLWKQDLREAIVAAAVLPRPLSVLGYSLGGVLSVCVADSMNEVAIDRLILLAPAIGLRRWVRCGEWLARAMPTWVPLRSGVPRRYRARSAVNSSWYQALFDIYHEAQSIPAGGRLSRTPILILISRRDEFIGWHELERWTARILGADVRMVALDPNSGYLLAPHHLVLDRDCFGGQEPGATKWREMLAAVLD